MLNGQPLPQRSPKLHSSGTICVHSAARSHSGGVNSQRGEEAWPQDPSARAIGTERGCVEDQPQRVGSSKVSGACSVLRLVEDDTAALRSNGGEVRVRGHANSNVSGSLLRLPKSEIANRKSEILLAPYFGFPQMLQEQCFQRGIGTLAEEMDAARTTEFAQALDEVLHGLLIGLEAVAAKGDFLKAGCFRVD